MDYKKYSLEKLQDWVHDAMSSDASPHEIYSAIREAVREDYYYHKYYTSRAYGLLELLSGHRPVENKSTLSCDKDDPSPECKGAWNDFWEEHYYPEEHQKHNEKVKDDCMPPWGHSDMEALRYTDEELNAMCDNAESGAKKNWEIVNEDSPYPIHISEDGDIWIPDSVTKEDKVVKWQLPVQVDGLTGDCFVQFPDDLLEAANLKEGDTVEWIDRKDGSFELRKVNGTK